MSVSPDKLDPKYSQAIAARLQPLRIEDLEKLVLDENFNKADFSKLEELSEEENFQEFVETLKEIKAESERKLAVIEIQEYVRELKAKAKSSANPGANQGPALGALDHAFTQPDLADLSNKDETPHPLLTPARDSANTHTGKRSEGQAPHLAAANIDWKQVTEKFSDRKIISEHAFQVNKSVIEYEPSTKGISVTSATKPPDIADMSKQAKTAFSGIIPIPNVQYKGGSMQQAITAYRELAPLVPELIDEKLKKSIEDAAKTGDADAKWFVEHYQKNRQESSLTGPSTHQKP